MTQDLATRSYWLGLDPYEPDAPLEGDMQADLVIVGGGFAGLWTAYHLLKADPGMTVVVIEGSAVGYGASGRNGGFAMTLIHRGLAALTEAVGAEQAKALHEGAVESIHGIGRICEAEGIDQKGADNAGIQALEVEHQHVVMQPGLGIHDVATGAGSGRRDVA